MNMCLYMNIYAYRYINMSVYMYLFIGKKECWKEGRKFRQSQSSVYYPKNLTYFIFYLICILHCR